MKPRVNEEKSTKPQGDQLQAPVHENPATAVPANSAADVLEIPPHEEPQSDGGTKIHGDKLEPHGGK